MKITLLSEESIRVEGTAGPLTIEAPTADTIYSPFHMLASSLAVCTYSILMSWASNADIPTTGLAIEVGWSFAEKPHRVSDVSLTAEWPDLPPARLEAARRVATLCPIHATLHQGASVEVAMRTTAGSTADHLEHHHA